MRPWDALYRKMCTARTRRIGPREAERLLSAAGSDPAYPELSALLAAAAAAPRPGERAGLEAALAAFETAAPAPAPTARRRWLTRSFVLKTATGTAVLLFGGTAVAATTGTLPAGAQRYAHDAFSAVGVPAPPSRRAEPTTVKTSAPAATPSNRGRTLAPTSPALKGLCQAWQAHQKRPNDPPMSAEAFRDLARAAGGEARIATLCAPFLDPEKSAEPEPNKPSKDKQPGKPSKTPKG
ncbi:hypothetical protein WEI85_33985 [Actinomycetes bacterium KLBMP 9797]